MGSHGSPWKLAIPKGKQALRSIHFQRRFATFNGVYTKWLGTPGRLGETGWFFCSPSMERSVCSMITFIFEKNPGHLRTIPYSFDNPYKCCTVWYVYLHLPYMIYLCMCIYNYLKFFQMNQHKYPTCKACLFYYPNKCSPTENHPGLSINGCTTYRSIAHPVSKRRCQRPKPDNGWPWYDHDRYPPGK